MVKTISVYSFLFLLAGCGDTSLWKGLGDDSEPGARHAAAQRALDKADCKTAVTLFAGLQAEDPDNVDRRLDLAAGYLCQAGFSVQGLMGIVADFAKNPEGTKETLMQKITAQAAAVVPDDRIWQGSVCSAKALLGDIAEDANPSQWPCASKKSGQTVVVFKNDPDAAYILTIVNLADATLAIADALKTIGGIAQCFEASLAGSSTCTITTNDLKSVADSLVIAAQVASVAGSGDPLFQTADNLFFNANANKDGQLNDEEILNYLLAQNIINPSNPQERVTVPANCQLRLGKYSCT